MKLSWHPILFATSFLTFFGCPCVDAAPAKMAPDERNQVMSSVANLMGLNNNALSDGKNQIGSGVALDNAVSSNALNGAASSGGVNGMMPNYPSQMSFGQSNPNGFSATGPIPVDFDGSQTRFGSANMPVPMNQGPSTVQNGMRAMQQQGPMRQNLDDPGMVSNMQGGASSSNLNQDCLARHNQVRSQLGLQLMQISPDLIQAAENELSSGGFTSNGGKKPYGINKIYGDPSDPGMGGVTPGTCISAFEDWYTKGKAAYRGQAIGQGDLNSYGGYTQIIWPTSTQLGCAERMIQGQLRQICLYLSPGNIYGKRLDIY